MRIRVKPRTGRSFAGRKEPGGRQRPRQSGSLGRRVLCVITILQYHDSREGHLEEGDVLVRVGGGGHRGDIQTAAVLIAHVSFEVHERPGMCARVCRRPRQSLLRSHPSPQSRCRSYNYDLVTTLNVPALLTCLLS